MVEFDVACLEQSNKFNHNKKTKASKRNKPNEFITPTNYYIFSWGELNPNHKGLAYYVTREF
jgi:hypothetical protein